MSQRINKLIDSFEEAVASVGHPYHEATLELLYAFEQMALTKGKERHANDLPFTEQKMQRIADAQGTTTGLTYQISKKAIEADRLPPEKAIQERYGAIVYAVGANIWAKRNLIVQTAPEETQIDKEQADGEEQPERGEHGLVEVEQADETGEDQETPQAPEESKKPVAKAPLVLSDEEQWEQDRADHDIENWELCQVYGGPPCRNCGSMPHIEQYRGAYNPPYPYRLIHESNTCPAGYQLEYYDTNARACRLAWETFISRRR